jgi:RNA polymerase sigma-70 factor (ECF subfamily)
MFHRRSEPGAEPADQSLEPDHAGPIDPRETSGAEESLSSLYRSQVPRLLRYFSRRLQCPEEARDLVQEAFTRMLSLGAGRRSALEKPEAYLSQIAHNLLKDHARSTSRRPIHLHVVADEAALPAADQEKLLETRDMLRRLERAMLNLKPKTREIFMAHRLDGLSYAEIAERTGLSIKGVEKQMSKAIAEVTRMLSRSSR